MTIEERLERIDNFCYSPVSFKPKTTFEKLWQTSIFSNKYKFNGIEVELPPLIKIDLLKFKNEKNVILYSGGKESYLTKQISDFYEIPYELLTFSEADKHDNLDTRKIVGYSRHVPAMYMYLLKAAQRNPFANIFVGNSWSNLYASFLAFKSFGQTDLLLYELNEDSDIKGSFYSVLNCLREFFVFSFAKKLGYDIKNSYNSSLDTSLKKQRILIFDTYDKLLTFIKQTDKELKEELFYQLDLPYMKFELKEPYIYDFRTSILKFVNEKVLAVQKNEN